MFTLCGTLPFEEVSGLKEEPVEADLGIPAELGTVKLFLGGTAGGVGEGGIGGAGNRD